MAFRIAYLILAHKCPSHLVRLVERLQGPERSFVIHVDRNSAGEEWDTAYAKLRQSNVLWAERVHCEWGAFSLVQAALNCIETLCASTVRFDTAVLLSGQDYPIKSNERIENYLASRSSECLMYIHAFPNHEWSWQGYYRLPAWRIRVAGKKRRVIPARFSRWIHPKVPLGYRPYGGSSWWALPREAVEHVRHFVGANPEFVRYFQQVIYPDEMMLHTILGNSPFRVPTGNHYLHFMKWTVGPHPAVLSYDDLPDMRASDKCFARKFDCETDGDLLAAIDSELL